MRFSHSAAIWAAFPSLVPGLLLVEGITAESPPSEQLTVLFALAQERIGSGSEADLPAIQAWRRAFSQMGLKPTQYRSAAEALLRRFRKEQTLPLLHPLVDLCNAASLAFALPVAVFDLNQVEQFLEVRYAEGDEQYIAFGGEVEHPDAGEVIFADAARQVHARRWTFRQSRRSTVSATTQRALIVSEGLHAGAADDVAALLERLEAALPGIGCRALDRTILSANTPVWSDGAA